MHSIINNIFTLLKSNNIDFCVLRNFDELHYKLPEGDIDILIDRKELNKLVKLVNNDSNQKPYLVMRHSKISVDFFFKVYDNDKIRTVNFEFRTSLCGYDNRGWIYEYINTDEALKSTKFNQHNIPVLSNAYYYIHLYHEIFYEKKIKYYNILKEITVSDNQRKIIKEHFTDEKFPDRLDNKLELKKTQSIYFFVVKYFFSLFRNIIYFFNPKGKLIIFLGPDGSGKTTICDSFVEKHKRSFSNTKRLNLASRPIFLKSIFGSNVKSEKSRESIPENTLFKHKPYSIPDNKTVLRNYFRIIYHCLDHILHYYIIIRPIMVKGGFIFSERYFYDYICSDKRYLPGVSIKFKKFLLFFVPKPSITCVLYVPPNELFKRKPELSLDQIEYEQEKYLNYNFRHTVHVIDNSKSIEQTVQSLEKIILKK